MKEEGPGWYGYPEMEAVWGVPMNDATFEDFQRIFKCLDLQNAKCNNKGLEFPTTCSKSPCDMCEKGELKNSLDMAQRINEYTYISHLMNYY